MLTAEQPLDEGRFAIDPFGGAPDAISRIAGLGGGRAPGEPGHVFRTMPVMAVPGRATFLIVFDDLSAAAGQLHIDLTVKGEGETAPAVRERTLVTPLAELARRGGATTLTFEAHPNMLYALAGYVNDSRAARAAGLRIALSSGGPTAPVDPVALHRLVSLEAPDFGAPVSQPMTPQQLRHPDFGRQLRRLDLRAGERWGPAFVLQALDRYGAARRDMRGLGLDACAGVATALANSGCTISRYDPSRPPAALPDEGGFDFAWSIAADEDVGMLERRIWAGVDRVVPGGIGVHLFPYRPGGGGIGRSDIERLALNIISFGREVAQLKFPPLAADAMVPYALIVRRQDAAA